jgi:hypothetical protein
MGGPHDDSSEGRENPLALGRDIAREPGRAGGLQRHDGRAYGTVQPPLLKWPTTEKLVPPPDWLYE